MKRIATMTLGLAVMAASPANRDVEAWVNQIAADYRGKYEQAANDMAKGLIRHKRAEAFCDPKGLISAGRGGAKDWTGTVSRLDAVSDGRGILAVQISPMVTVETTNNDFSEKFGENKTLIDVNSPLYAIVVALKVDQRIRFSGTFFRSPDDCMKETSLTIDGSMTEPSFLFRFAEVTPID